MNPSLILLHTHNNYKNQLNFIQHFPVHIQAKVRKWNIYKQIYYLFETKKHNLEQEEDLIFTNYNN